MANKMPVETFKWMVPMDLTHVPPSTRPPLAAYQWKAAFPFQLEAQQNYEVAVRQVSIQASDSCLMINICIPEVAEGQLLKCEGVNHIRPLKTLVPTRDSQNKRYFETDFLQRMEWYHVKDFKAPGVVSVQVVTNHEAKIESGIIIFEIGKTY